jgi:protein-tyrosine phosphatase
MMDAHEIVPNLWQGSRARCDSLGDFDVVISMARPVEIPARRGQDVYCLSIVDPMWERDFDDRQMRKAVLASNTAFQAVRAGRKTLVLCEAGQNRSGFVVALTLMRLGMRARGAIDTVQKRRPKALNNIHFRRWLEKIGQRMGR